MVTLVMEAAAARRGMQVRQGHRLGTGRTPSDRPVAPTLGRVGGGGNSAGHLTAPPAELARATNWAREPFEPQYPVPLRSAPGHRRCQRMGHLFRPAQRWRNSPRDTPHQRPQNVKHVEGGGPI